MYRLQGLWVWPHIMILALVCLMIDTVRPNLVGQSARGRGDY